MAASIASELERTATAWATEPDEIEFVPSPVGAMRRGAKAIRALLAALTTAREFVELEAAMRGAEDASYNPTAASVLAKIDAALANRPSEAISANGSNSSDPVGEGDKG